jgi:hypothetical protein
MRNMLAGKPDRRHYNRSYRKTSWRHFYICSCRIAGKSVNNILQGFWQKKTLSIWASCVIFIGKTDEISRTLHWCTKSFQNKSRSVLFLRQELTENNLRKWRDRYDWYQRRVADKTCRFLITGTVHFEEKENQAGKFNNLILDIDLTFRSFRCYSAVPLKTWKQNPRERGNRCGLLSTDVTAEGGVSVRS